MRIAVVHHTRYRYSSPVFLEPHVMRLRPREDPAQRLVSWNLDIAPEPAGRNEYLDQEGNSVVRAWFRDPTEELSLRSEFVLDTVRDNPFNYVLTTADTRLPMQYPSLLAAALAPDLPVDESPEVNTFARGLAARHGGE